jgi:cysteinyl-tRNA synthetase
MKSRIKSLVFDIFGLQAESQEENGGTTDGLMKLIISLRTDARNRKDWASSDLIRDSLKELGIQLKDGKEGTGWTRD